MLTNYVKYAMNMSSMSKKILRDFVVESQINSQTSHHIEGLRVLACIIARDLVSKRQDNTKKKKDRELSAPQILERCR
jgi:hypothetical protein